MNFGDLFKCLTEEFGWEITQRQLRRWIEKDRVPCVMMPNGRLSFPRRLILPWAERKQRNVAV